MLIMKSICQSSKAKYETGMRRYGQIQYDQTPLLDAEEYKRYGRQMILPEVGLDGWSGSDMPNNGRKRHS